MEPFSYYLQYGHTKMRYLNNSQQTSSNRNHCFGPVNNATCTVAIETLHVLIFETKDEPDIL